MAIRMPGGSNSPSGGWRACSRGPTPLSNPDPFMAKRCIGKLPAGPAAAVVLVGAMMCPGQSPSAKPSSSAPEKPRIQDAWDAVIQNPLPQAPDPVLSPPQVNVKRGAAGDFLNHFFLEARTEY